MRMISCPKCGGNDLEVVLRSLGEGPTGVVRCACGHYGPVVRGNIHVEAEAVKAWNNQKTGE